MHDLLHRSPSIVIIFRQSSVLVRVLLSVTLIYLNLHHRLLSYRSFVFLTRHSRPSFLIIRSLHLSFFEVGPSDPHTNSNISSSIVSAIIMSSSHHRTVTNTFNNPRRLRQSSFTLCGHENATRIVRFSQQPQPATTAMQSRPCSLQPALRTDSAYGSCTILTLKNAVLRLGTMSSRRETF